MNRTILWEPATGVGLEQLHIIEDKAGVTADSVIIGTDNGDPFRARYDIECDRAYRVQRINIDVYGDKSHSLSLRIDGAGYWATEVGTHLPALDDCIDVDISVTPFTNTLPIRRIELERDESTDLSVVYLTVPELDVSTNPQRYICRDPLDANGGHYTYESLSSDFTADLPVDEHGLVIDYPNLFMRVRGSEERIQ